jgi:hypothetical protein
MVDDGTGHGSAKLVLIGHGDGARHEAERFIADRFRSTFGARASTCYPTIAAVFDTQGRIAAAAGVRFAEQAPLFLERYLEDAVEQAVAAAFERPVERAAIVEIGGFAAASVSNAILLFDAMARWLFAQRRRYAVATVRPELARLLRHTGFGLRPMADADAERLGAEAASWGTYYEAGPRVFAGEIAPAPGPCGRQRPRPHRTPTPAIDAPEQPA